MDNVKAIRVGDKIIVFVNGKRQTISKSVSPETFEIVLQYIKDKKTNRISEVFNSFDDKISEYLKDQFKIKNGYLYDKDSNKELTYSKLIIRKAIEMMALNLSPLPLKVLSNKIEYKENISDKGVEVFKKVKKLTITTQGNLIFYTNLEHENKININKTENSLIGSPIMLNESRVISYSLTISKENNTKVLVNPFDIVSFTDNTINVSRFKILENKEIDDCITEIENEKLFDLSFDIFRESEKKDKKDILNDY